MVNKMRSWYMWDWHPATTNHQDKTFGDRMADKMKAYLATWAALFLVLAGIGTWVVVDPHFDRFPFVLLNLCLSCFAALQCFVLLIANKRGEQVAAEIAEHTESNTEKILDGISRIEKVLGSHGVVSSSASESSKVLSAYPKSQKPPVGLPDGSKAAVPW